ncbi:STAS domain-containing protein [Methanosphaera sp. ISO3-F5]|uniref:STAS domain-containing protein n=1 Tax=Methanosphaera sp. ISO3-F5 TaxID=1452353 RepID=UPI002B25A3DE|nr:STAS domain-containing protein [Methanosphaera sp. ISO3-F5]WQH65238.1 STAS domain-containing protein [Methanosphaera sp. ISO3-F5]
MSNAINYITSKGFKLERIPYADHVPELRTLKNTDPKIVAHINEGLKKVCIWKISVDESVKADTFNDKTQSFNVNASIDDESLNIILSGNLDTLSAPELLAYFENIKKENIINSVIIDCSKLEYVSSAGIRVLLIMHNNCKDGLVMKSCNETVIRDLSNTNIKIQ